MKLRIRLPFVVVPLLLVLAQACGGGPTGESAEALTDDELGLDKESVFSTPDPILASITAGEPGENESLGAYFSGSPPAISHDISEFLPIRIDENYCLECHDVFDQIGTEIATGDPTPMPASHYTDLRRSPDEVSSKVIGARFNCTQCHTPLTDAAPLVANTYTR